MVPWYQYRKCDKGWVVPSLYVFVVHVCMLGFYMAILDLGLFGIYSYARYCHRLQNRIGRSEAGLAASETRYVSGTETSPSTSPSRTQSCMIPAERGRLDEGLSYLHFRELLLDYIKVCALTGREPVSLVLELCVRIHAIRDICVGFLSIVICEIYCQNSDCF